ncbi:MAG TPA: hypothetical protein VK171_02040 [Fimbriimonas sp.]|nr:hypothetical protein [Fimbriimonas sp.]
MNEERAAKFLQKYKDQNKLARRIGLPMLRTVYTILVAAAFLQIVYYSVTYMNEKGWLSPPQLEEARVN